MASAQVCSSVYAVLDTIVVIPSAPLLIPGLADVLASEVRDLNRGCLAALQTISDTSDLLVIAPAPRAASYEPGQVLIVDGFTASDRPRPTCRVPGVAASGPAVADAALGTLVAVTLLERCGYRGRAHCRQIPDTGADQLDIPGGITAALVVVDGDSTRISRHLASGENPDQRDDALTAGLATGDVAGLRAVITGANASAGTAALAWLAAAADTGKYQATCLYRQTPFGICYQVWTWTRGRR